MFQKLLYSDVLSFAFVEYESRRDADDAYHEMHNKRIGRDDLLKIEVCFFALTSLDFLIPFSGHEHPRLHPGDSILAVIVPVTSVIVETVAASDHLPDEVHDPLPHAAVTILLAKMIAVIATMIAETDLAALMIVTATVT